MNEDAVKAAMRKVAEGIHDYVKARADQGDMECLVSAVVLYETRGFEADGSPFERQSYFIPEEYGATRAQVLGLLQIAGGEMTYDLIPSRLNDDR